MVNLFRCICVSLIQILMIQSLDNGAKSYCNVLMNSYIVHPRYSL